MSDLQVRQTPKDEVCEYEELANNIVKVVEFRTLHLANRADLSDEERTKADSVLIELNYLLKRRELLPVPEYTEAAGSDINERFRDGLGPKIDELVEVLWQRNTSNIFCLGDQSFQVEGLLAEVDDLVRLATRPVR